MGREWSAVEYRNVPTLRYELFSLACLVENVFCPPFAEKYSFVHGRARMDFQPIPLNIFKKQKEHFQECLN